MDWVLWSEADLNWIRAVGHARRNPGNQRTKKPRLYKDLCCAWDIEDCQIPGTKDSAVYHWQLQLGPEHPTIYGRTIEEYRLFMDRLVDVLEPQETLVIYVHNLAHEFAFLRGIFPEIRTIDVFAVAPRRPARVDLYSRKIEYRCSYILTNMGLDPWTKNMGIEDAKRSSDEYDHTKIRYPWTELTDEEKLYCQNDVLGLVEALQVQLDLHHDSLATVPSTATGYIRRDVKACMRNWSYWGMQRVQPNDRTYLALREAFRGGNTHANRFYAGHILQNVRSCDRSSSYPDVMINRPFPMDKLKVDPNRSERHLAKLVKDVIPFLARIRFTGLRLKDPYDPCPYLSFSKMRDPMPERSKKEFFDSAVLDNGRILSIETADTTVIDLDWRIILEHYQWDQLQVLDLWKSEYDMLPDMLRRLIIDLYKQKTELKGKEGSTPEETALNKLNYNKSKEKINSCFGLAAQDPCKEKILYVPDPGPKEEIFQRREGDVHHLLAQATKRPYMSYMWSCWVTGWARFELQLAIDAAGDNFVYCDTDSVKYLGELDLAEYNAEKIRNSKASGAYAADPKGRIHYAGVFEEEDPYLQFITMGAKKYAYVTGKGLGVTVSGVSKKHGAAELEAAGGLAAFKEGFIFHAGGGLDPHYNDHSNYDIEIDGHQLHIGPNVCLMPSTYKLALGKDYGALLRNIKLLQEMLHDDYIRSALQPEGDQY